MLVSLWNDLATGVGQELLDIADKSPIVAIKSLKVGDFQGKVDCLQVWLCLKVKIPLLMTMFLILFQVYL